MFIAALFLAAYQKYKQTEIHPFEKTLTVQTLNTEAIPSQD